MDAITELVARSKPHEDLLAFHEFHRANPQVLDFLVAEIRLRIDSGFEAFSFGSLAEYARWKLQIDKGPGETFALNDHNATFYSRATIILHPEFNGRCEFRVSKKVDPLFGTEIAQAKRPCDYAKRLQWADGRAIENGWRPRYRHVVVNVASRKPDIHAR